MQSMILVKKAAGTEGGTTVTITGSGGTGAAAALVNRISGWAGTLATDVECSTSVNELTNTPNPGSITASWGSADNLFFEIICMIAADGTVTSASANFTSIQNIVSGQGAISAASVGQAQRAVATDTQNPGTATLSTSQRCMSYTLVVKPAPASPVITDVNTDNEADIGGSTTINGTNLDTVLSNGVRLQDSTATYTQGQTINTQSATAINISTLSLGNVPRTSASHQIQMRVTDGSTPDTQDITILDATGFITTEIQDDLGTDQSLAYLINGGTVANGSQLYGPTTTRGGATITYYPDGHFETGPGGTEPDYIDDIQLWTAADGWTVPQDIEINDAPVDAVAEWYENGIGVNSLGQALLTETLPDAYEYCNGMIIGTGGIVYVDDVTGAGVPANPTYVNGLAFTSAGALCIAIETPEASYFDDPKYVNGLALRFDGAVYVSEVAPTANDNYVNGLVFSQEAELRVSIS
jgi:hypothetical protein